MSLDDNFILEMVAKADRPPHFLTDEAINVPEGRYNQFNLGDMLGEINLGYRKIKNPKVYDPKVESPNPEYFDVIEFENGGFWLTEVQRWNGGITYHSFYYDGQTIRYTDKLFDSY